MSGRAPARLLNSLRRVVKVLFKAHADRAASAADPGLRAEFLDPTGFTLTVRAVGPHFQLRVNDRLVLEATDPRPDSFRTGRFGIAASRLMATFASLHITTLD